MDTYRKQMNEVALSYNWSKPFDYGQYRRLASEPCHWEAFLRMWKLIRVPRKRLKTFAGHWGIASTPTLRYLVASAIAVQARVYTSFAKRTSFSSWWLNYQWSGCMALFSRIWIGVCLFAKSTGTLQDTTPRSFQRSLHFV